MTVFIAGGAKCGKSAIAQELAVKLAGGGKLYYVATMIPTGAEDDDRIRRHQAIRDDLLRVLRGVEGAFARTPEAGSYLFPRLPALAVAPSDFVRILRLQARAVVTPGTEFGPHSADSVRLNFSQDQRQAVASVERIAMLLERYRD